MKPLSFEEILEIADSGDKLEWHPEYDFQAWKDGLPPLSIVHCSFLSSEIDKETGEKVVFYFVGYNCAMDDCPKCATRNVSTELGTHHSIVRTDGFAPHSRVETIEKKKKTIIEKYDDPVFVKYGTETELNDWLLVLNPQTMALPNDQYVRLMDNKTKLITTDLAACNFRNMTALTISGSKLRLNKPNAGWIRWLKSKGRTDILEQIGA